MVVFYSGWGEARKLNIRNRLGDKKLDQKCLRQKKEEEEKQVLIGRMGTQLKCGIIGEGINCFNVEAKIVNKIIRNVVFFYLASRN